MIRKFTVPIGAALVLFACKTELPDSEVAARVNGKPITKADFEKAVERNLARYKGQAHQLPPGIETRIKESVLRRMVNDEVISQKGKELGLDVTPAELDEKFKEHKDRFRTEQAFQDYLKRSGNTVENMKNDVRRNLLRDRVVEKMSGAVEVNEEEIKKYYEEHAQRFQEKEQIKASRILVRVQPNAAPAEKAKAKKSADQLRAKAANTGTDFAALAKENSKGPEAGRGGDLGWLTKGRMPAEFDAVAFALEPDAVSKVIETRLGYEIVKVWGKKPERQRPLEEVKASIENSLTARKRNEKRREVLRQLKGGAKVDTLITFERPGPAATPPGRPPHPAKGLAKGLPPTPKAPSAPPTPGKPTLPAPPPPAAPPATK